MEDCLQEKLKKNTHRHCIYVSCSNEKAIISKIARFKVEYPDLIDEAFKTTIKIAKKII